jgi:hypothetical protein
LRLRWSTMFTSELLMVSLFVIRLAIVISLVYLVILVRLSPTQFTFRFSLFLLPLRFTIVTFFDFNIFVGPSLAIFSFHALVHYSFKDATWASDPLDRRSLSAYCGGIPGATLIG